MDPTHVRPLPPPLLEFLVQSCGFARVAILRLNEGLPADAPVSLIDVLAGVSPDYSIVARKPGGAESGELDELFARRVGFNLNDMAERYDARARELERRTLVAEGVREHAVAQLFHARQARRQAEDLVAAMHASTSWRVTAPLRAFGSWMSESRRRGLRAFARAVLQRMRGAPSKEASHAQHAQPLPAPATVATPPAPAQPPQPMTATARRLHQEMLEARGGVQRKEA
jgi:O-antigen chain-terminating methyltransferase